jgi:hypothetical protein
MVQQKYAKDLNPMVSLNLWEYKRLQTELLGKWGNNLIYCLSHLQVCFATECIQILAITSCIFITHISKWVSFLLLLIFFFFFLLFLCEFLKDRNNFVKRHTLWAWWYTSVIPVLRRLRQQDHEFEASEVSSRPVWAT